MKLFNNDIKDHKEIISSLNVFFDAYSDYIIANYNNCKYKNNSKPHRENIYNALFREYFSKLILSEFKLINQNGYNKKADDNSNRNSEKSFTFTKREMECLNFLHQGLNNKQIARQLNLSPRTIEEYFNKIKFKMGCKSRLQIVLMNNFT